MKKRIFALILLLMIPCGLLVYNATADTNAEKSTCIKVINTEENQEGIKKSVIGYVKFGEDKTISTEYVDCISLYSFEEAIENNVALPETLEYEQIKKNANLSEIIDSFKNNKNNFTIIDSFYLEANCNSLKKIMTLYNTSIDLTFDLDIPANTPVKAYAYKNDKWIPIKKILNNNENSNAEGSITLTLNNLGPIMIAAVDEYN